MRNDKEWIELISRISSGVANDEELSRYNAWCNALQSQGLPVSDFAAKEMLMLNNINQKIDQSRVIRLRYYKVAAVAAVIAVVLGFWFLFTPDSGHQSSLVSGSQFANDIKPGKNAAVLTLPNGKRIILGNAKNGIIVDDKRFSYNDGTELKNQDLMLATVSTPRGGTYQVTLSDGTHIWMNADSKLSFPSKFSGKERKVQLQGEAYFEVAKMKHMPFVVITDKQQVQVLGTHFNINSYRDEGTVTTTLLEGSVKVSATGGNETILKPGDQAVNTGHIQVRKVDLNEAVAWKNGSIVFRDKTLDDIMRELSRWYNVTIVYAEDAPKHVTFSGAVSRTRNLSTVLERMQTTGSVKFKIEGRTVTVTK